MKSCPTCKRTFEDSFTFCLIDGSVLSAPLDSQATLVIPEPRQTAPPPTEVLKSNEETVEEIPPTVDSPQPEWKSQEAEPTIASPVPQLSAMPAQTARKSSRAAFVMMGVGVLLIIGFISFVIISRKSNVAQNSTNSNQTGVATATPSTSPTLTPVSSLEGTIWQEVSDDDNRKRLHYFYRFKPDGKLTRDYTFSSDDTELNGRDGTWTKQGNDLTINFDGSDNLRSKVYKLTIEGNEMKGKERYFDNQSELNVEFRRVK